MAVLALLLAAASPVAVRAQTVSQDAASTDDHQILVMLRLSPDHFRPNGSYGGDYGETQSSSARHHLAGRIARQNGLDLVDKGWPMPLLGLDCYVMRVPANLTPAEAAERVSRDPRVAWSQPMRLYQTKGSTTARGDPLLAIQPASTSWHLTELHKMATGRGVTIAVIDSRIELNHPDLAGQFVTSQDFLADHPGPAERHGTGIAGVIAARADNGIGIAGIAPDARLMALRACWQTGPAASAPTLCNSLGLAQAIHFAILHHAAVINMSLAGPNDRLIDKLIDIAEARNISVVAAYDATLPGGGFPASKTGVIAVTNEALASPPPGVYRAPGDDIPTTQPGGKWSLVDGSSYAAAHVSGLIALVRQERAAAPRPLLLVSQRADGAIDACATLLRAGKACDCACPTTRLAVAAR
jgi:hypothetical protein